MDIEEIVITPEMIEAGVDALWDAHIYDSDNPNGATPEEAVTEIYQAMEKETRAVTPESVRLKAIETTAREFIQALASGDTSSDEKLAELRGMVG